jgi:PAS domain S-box-containing protein
MRHNAYLTEVTGISNGELSNQVWWACLVPPPEQPRARAWFLRTAVRGAEPRCVLPLAARDGRVRTVTWYGTDLPRLEGNASTVLLIGHDVTELHEAQQHALQAERLAAIGQMMTALTHESRNAIQRTHACLERLAWKLEGREDALELVHRAERAQEDLLHLFEDVRAYAAPIQIKCDCCDVSEVWREAWMEVTGLCPERDAVLLEQADGVDRSCCVDRFRLGQVFDNIFDNSLAACRDPVRVTVTARDAELAGRPALQIAVRDNGPGLTAEQRQRVFEPFFTTKPKGTGLGMAIAQRILEAHGGHIGVGDGSGEPGAEFIITLPRSTKP